MEILKKGDYARITYCDNCGSQLMYRHEDIYADTITEQHENMAYRYSIRFVLCPVCRKRIILDKDFTNNQ
jgi:uncharacterized protein with PIN domain